MKRVLLSGALLLMVAIRPSYGQTPAAAEILQNMKRQFETVKDYTAQLKVTVDM